MNIKPDKEIEKGDNIVISVAGIPSIWVSEFRAYHRFSRGLDTLNIKNPQSIKEKVIV